MKISFRILFRMLFVAAVSFGFSASLAFAQTAFTDGAAAGLSAAQVKKLNSLAVAIAVPTVVPAGFKLKKVDVPTTDEPGLVDYNLIYQNAAGKTFTIQSANEGIGDVVAKEEATGKNPYFDGEFYAGHDESANDGKGDGSVGAQWIGSLKKYEPKTQKLTQYYALNSAPKSISVQTAVRVMKSLRYLKR